MTDDELGAAIEALPNVTKFRIEFENRPVVVGQDLIRSHSDGRVHVISWYAVVGTEAYGEVCDIPEHSRPRGNYIISDELWAAWNRGESLQTKMLERAYNCLKGL